jgi:UDP-N-acetylmuramyl pentapeptide phosphotransferase/UDP-N-acetylglucosamine-1-phosphate transferase
MLEILNYEMMHLFSAFFISFVVVFISIPSIVKVAHKKHLFDLPGHRASHTQAVPTLGGLAIFAGFIFSISVLPNVVVFPQESVLIAASVIIFFIGLKDDILVTAPLTKMSGQIVAAFILVFIGDLHITSLHGFYGITEIPYWASCSLSIFIIVVIINAFNLIDGIDGLSSGVGIVTASTFGIWFFLAQKIQWSIIAFALVGSLIAFFIYNVFGKRNKIFMGDTGSLLLGLIVSVLTIQFNEFNINAIQIYRVHAAPAVSFGILIVPLFDTLRIIFVRLVLRKSPFSPDRNHIHHRLLDYGFSHKISSFIIILVNLIYIAFVFYFSKNFEILRLMLLLLISAMVLSHFITILSFKNKKKVITKTKYLEIPLKKK